MERFNLVVQTAFIGDLLLTIPLLKHLRQIDPSTKIILLCRKGFGDFFLKKNLVDQIVEVKKGADSNWQEVTKILSAINFEKVISPHQSFRTAKLVYKLNAKQKIGFKRFWNFFVFDRRVQWRHDLPEALRLLILLDDLDLNIKDKLSRKDQNYLKMTTQILDGTSLQLEEKPKSNEGVVFLAPGSEWATKRWTIDGYVEVAKHFLKKGYKVKIVGTKAESILAEKILSQAQECENLCGHTTLSELYDQFRAGTLLVSNDSGAMHMATVAGLPVVAVFGPTVLDFGYRPWTSKAVIVEKQLSCRPCGLHGSQKCPIGTHECMRGLSSQKVIDAANSFL